MSQTASSVNYRLGSLYSVITAFLYATQEPFSFPAAKHLNTLQFVALTQVSLLVSHSAADEPAGQPPRFRRPVSKTRQLRLSGRDLRRSG